MFNVPLAGIADSWIGDLAPVTGATLLGERASLGGFRIPGRVSAGGGCFLFDALDGVIALNLARAADRELLPALFETDEATIEAAIASREVLALLRRGREMGLALAAVDEIAGPPCQLLCAGAPVAREAGRPPKIIDLSALWAGPLAAHLLWLHGADVVKVESRSRPDAMRNGDPAFYARLNQGKASVVLDFAEAAALRALKTLILSADIVIEAARPRALAQLGIEAAALIAAKPGLVWVTITGHGAVGEAANWVGFGDDSGVAGGLAAAMRAASGKLGFVGDAIADPLTGIFAARTAWDAYVSGSSGRFGLSMSGVVAEALSLARKSDARALDTELIAWAAAEGQAFPEVEYRAARALPDWGADTQKCLAGLPPC
jgi:hypothetical protein